MLQLPDQEVLDNIVLVHNKDEVQLMSCMRKAEKKKEIQILPLATFFPPFSTTQCRRMILS